MAVCSLVPYAAEDVAAMRLVTSLTLVQAQLKNVFIVSLIVVAAILGFTVASGLYFVRGIVVPLGRWSGSPPASPGENWMSACL